MLDIQLSTQFFKCIFLVLESLVSWNIGLMKKVRYHLETFKLLMLLFSWQPGSSWLCSWTSLLQWWERLLRMCRGSKKKVPLQSRSRSCKISFGFWISRRSLMVRSTSSEFTQMIEMTRITKLLVVLHWPL